MTFGKWSAVALMMMLFVGCGDSTETVDAPADGAGTNSTGGEAVDASDTETADASASTNETSTNEPSGDANKSAGPTYVALPEDADSRLIQAYAQVTRAAASGEARDLLNLAGISQQAASMLASDNPDAAYSLFKQAAKALREAIPKHDGDLPGSFVGPVFYNEACALSIEGDVDGAMASLEEAITSGFSDFDLVQSDTDLAAVREVADFDAKLNAWKTAAIEKIKAHAKEELAAGETFPFEFKLTDLEGEERSLADYKGKVVIVDIWGTWCPPCREEIPSVHKASERIG